MTPARQETPELHGSYTRWWTFTIAPAIIADVLGWTAAVAVLLSIAAVVEIVAIVVRRRPGDTLSEHVWAIIRRYPATVPPAIGLAVWLVWSAFRLLPATAPHLAGWPPVGLYFFGLGVFGWLVVHFAEEGRHG